MHRKLTIENVVRQALRLTNVQLSRVRFLRHLGFCLKGDFFFASFFNMLWHVSVSQTPPHEYEARGAVGLSAAGGM